MNYNDQDATRRPVKEWSEEQLEAWARDNITDGTLPRRDWHQRQVAIWARIVLGSEKSAQVLINEEINGRRLLRVPNVEKLQAWGIPGGAALALWDAIETLKFLSVSRFFVNG